MPVWLHMSFHLVLKLLWRWLWNCQFLSAELYGISSSQLDLHLWVILFFLMFSNMSPYARANLFSGIKPHSSKRLCIWHTSIVILWVYCKCYMLLIQKKYLPSFLKYSIISIREYIIKAKILNLNELLFFTSKWISSPARFIWADNFQKGFEKLSFIFCSFLST